MEFAISTTPRMLKPRSLVVNASTESKTSTRGQIRAVAPGKPFVPELYLKLSTIVNIKPFQLQQSRRVSLFLVFRRMVVGGIPSQCSRVYNQGQDGADIPMS